MAHEPLATVVGQLVSMEAEQGCNLGLDGLRQQRSRAVAQNLGQRISKSSWLGELQNVSGRSWRITPSVEKWRLEQPPRYAALPLQAVTNFRP